MLRIHLRIVIAVALFLWVIHLTEAQQTPAHPKLIVGVIVDQMRFDQLYKYKERFGQDGFNRLMTSGYNFKNSNYNYIPTLTAPGHTSIYSGTTPSIHGIVGNAWYDRSGNKVVGNVEDSLETLVGSVRPNPYGISPRRMLATTVTDQLRLATNFRAKVVSVSLKDRGAVLPGGHTANAAYWHDLETSPGYFVSSTYYMDKLPGWVSAFNQSGKSDAYLNQTWNTLYPVNTYVQSAPDDNAYERAIGGKKSPTFPYDLKQIRERFRDAGSEYQLLWLSPFGNNLLTEFAVEAVKNEALGKDAVTDFLCISYTVTDIVGHTLGPQAVEMEDVFLRLDKNIAELLAFLDKEVGKDQYILFLTSDHGSVPVASQLKDQKIPTGVVPTPVYKGAVANYLSRKYGAFNWILNFDNEQLYLNRQLIEERKLQLDDFQKDVANFLIRQKGISGASTAGELESLDYSYGLKNLVQKGYHAKRSGDVILTLDPGYVFDPIPNMTPEKVKGTTHGTGYTYDTHVPMLWYGKGIRAGESVRSVSPTDIAPTLSLMLDIQFPNGSTGQPLEELFAK